MHIRRNGVYVIIPRTPALADPLNYMLYYSVTECNYVYDENHADDAWSCHTGTCIKQYPEKKYIMNRGCGLSRTRSTCLHAAASCLYIITGVTLTQLTPMILCCEESLKTAVKI